MTILLASLLQEAAPSADSKLLDRIDRFPAQVIILAGQLSWSESCEDSLMGTAKSTDELQTCLRPPDLEEQAARVE